MSSPLSSHSTEPPKKSFYRKPLFIGCFGFFVLFTLVLTIGLFWLFSTGKTYLSDKIREAVVEQIENSELSADHQIALKREVDRLTEQFQKGEISIQELIQILEGIEQSPAMSIIRYYQIEGNPLERSSITPEQKQAALLTIRRFIYGVFEERIPDSAIEQLVEPFILERGHKKDYSDLEFRTDITDEEIFKALDKAKAYADQAGIREENLSPDLAREIREIIDRILSKRQ